uniref:Sosondowah ankyrin repeat domain family member D n=1 Tax=Latimeria chalumnae TaxID=7897 RepID=H3AKP0_LATCH
SPVMRRDSLKEVLLNSGLQNGFGSMRIPCGRKATEKSSSPEEPPGDSSVALDPVEHEWMLAIAEGNYNRIIEFLLSDPSLLMKKDFVTGLTAVHWLAKHGDHEALIKVANFCESRGFAVNVNITASGGLTPLHLAAMQGHEMVIKVLVGAYNADVNARDFNGRKAWQYLKSSASAELKELTGAIDEEINLATQNYNNNGNRFFTKQTSETLECEVDSPLKGSLFSRLSSFKKFWSPLQYFGKYK